MARQRCVYATYLFFPGRGRGRLRQATQADCPIYRQNFCCQMRALTPPRTHPNTTPTPTTAKTKGTWWRDRRTHLRFNSPTASKGAQSRAEEGQGGEGRPLSSTRITHVTGAILRIPRVFRAHSGGFRASSFVCQSCEM